VPDLAAADAAGERRLSIIAADFKPSLSLFRVRRWTFGRPVLNDNRR
jgi:hypothetical protein